MTNVLEFDIDRSINLVKLHACSSVVNRRRNIKVVVQDSDDVVFVKNGQIVDNIVDNIIHKRIKSDVHKYYFVNKQLVVQEDFITKDFLEYRDYVRNDLVSLGARCIVHMSVSDSKLFVQKLVDLKKEYTKHDLLHSITPKILEHFGGCLLQIINTQKIEYNQLDAHKTKIDELLLSKMQHVVDEYGIKIVKFCILQFISPLHTTLLLSARNSTKDITLPQLPQSTIGSNCCNSNIHKQDNTKELIALIEDQLSVLVDKSLDKIQLFVDQTMQDINTQLRQQLDNNIVTTQAIQE